MIQRVCVGVDFERAVAALRNLSGHEHAGSKINLPYRQCAFDGKNRISAPKGTGNSEIDFTLFDVDAAAILAKKIVGAKEGGQPMVCELVASICLSLATGFVTGDAGIVSTDITRLITDAFHDYLFALKGNAGQAYHLVKNLPWREFEFDATEVDYGHSRMETRVVRVARILGCGIPDLEKCAHNTYIGEIVRYRSINSTPEETTTAHYVIGSEQHVEMIAEGIAAALNKHWRLENHLHRFRDVELGEVDFPAMSAKMSCICGYFCDIATWLANGVTKGVRYFFDRMKTDLMALQEAWLGV
jgi:hypothetical protein